MGKTYKGLRPLIKYYKNRKTSVLIISDKVSLSNHLCKTLDIEIYKNVERDITPENCPLVTVQLDSIYRIKGHYDVVVLDEYCSLQNSFVNPTMKKISLVLSVFQTQIKFAKHVILCDADIVDDKLRQN